jgi:hypothetical protein
MRFQATLELGGKTATGIRVPDDVVEALGSGKRPPVSVTINGHTYRSTVAVLGGVFMLPVSAEQRAAAGIAAGDVVDVDLSLDTAPRTVELPDDLAAELSKHPSALAAYDALSPSNKKRHVLSVEGAKTTETRRRRIDKVLTELSGD